MPIGPARRFAGLSVPLHELKALARAHQAKLNDVVMALCSGALRRYLQECGDPLPAGAKLAWWGEELRGWASQRSRHPLGRRLEPVRADWARLADALPTLAEARTVPRDREAGFAALSRCRDIAPHFFRT